MCSKAISLLEFTLIYLETQRRHERKLSASIFVLIEAVLAMLLLRGVGNLVLLRPDLVPTKEFCPKAGLCFGLCDELLVL